MKKTLKAPSTLSPEARRWWALIVSAYEISAEDPAGLLLLQTALESWDSMRKSEELVKKLGAVYKDRFGMPKQNPACLNARDARLAMLRALKQLNLDIQPGAPLGSRES
jgi:P27 family predicted phage terminase small subunit